VKALLPGAALRDHPAMVAMRERAERAEREAASYRRTMDVLTTMAAQDVRLEKALYSAIAAADAGGEAHHG
jgi:hypothetical protein